MPGKIMEFSRDARSALLSGVRQLAGAVRVTLGPGGRNVALGKKWGAPTITKDGATVAKEIELPDKLENVAVSLLRQVAVKTGDVVGDGTTTATVLAEAIFDDSLRHVEAGVNPIALARGIEKGVQAVVEDLKKSARPVEGKDVEHVASVAANNDAAIGKLIAQAIDEVGKDGAVTVEEAKGIETKIEKIDGMQFDKGYISPHFMNKPDKLQCVLDKPLILVHEKRISTVKTLVPILEKVSATKRPLLIIADDVEAEALAVLVVNRLRGVFQSCAVKAPGFGDRRKEMLEDIAVFTGGKAIFEDVGEKLEDIAIEDLGTARRVIIDKENTTIIEGKGSDEAIKGRINLIRKAIDQATSDYDKEKLQERLSKLSGGVAQVNVGAATEIEMKEKRARIEDALHASRAAIEEGVVPGGGVALLRSRRAVDALDLSGDEKVGADILRRALEQPIRQIVENAGAAGSVVIHKIEKSDDYARGYNVQTGEYQDLIKAGVLDPKKVVRLALQNAASMACIFLTTEAIITEKEEAPGDDIPHGPGEGPSPGMMGMPGMGGGMPGMGGMGGMPGMGGF